MKRRLFLAIQLPDEMKTELGKYKKMVDIQGATWVPTPNLHVTVYFLNRVDEKVIDDLSADVRAAVAGIAPFTLVPRHMMFAPSADPARMVWLLFNGSQDFTHLVEKSYYAVTTYVDGHNPREEDRVVPHITLARIAPPSAQEMELPQVGLQDLFVSSIDLVESDLQHEGAQYGVLDTFPFGG